MPETNPLLELKAVSKRFGGVAALSSLGFEVKAGELLGLIGPNGSGKTTAFNLITGVMPPSGGSIRFRGQDITRSNPARNAALGMSRTFQNIRLFPDLSALDNVAIGAHMRHSSGLWSTIAALPAARKSEKRIYEYAREMLSVVDLARRADELVANLPYGDRRKIELARALATDPVLVLLDEPAAGMNPQETKTISDTITHIHRDRDVTVVLVEHDMKLVMSICERLLVINQGCMLATGDPQQIRHNPDVIKAYLGRSQETD